MKPIDLVPALLAALAGLLSLYLAIGLAGGGHGWVVPAFVSMGLVVGGPIVGLLWLARRRKWKEIPAAFGLIAFGIADFLIAIGLVSADFGKAWHYVPGLVVLWFVTWFYPQVLLITALAWRASGPEN